MAYSNYNLLRRIIEIQDLTLRYKSDGRTQTWIYRHIIAPEYYISWSTYNNYLSRNAKKEMREAMKV